MNDTQAEAQESLLDEVQTEDIVPATENFDEVDFDTAAETESIDVAGFGLGPLKKVLDKSVKRTAENPNLNVKGEPDFLETDIEKNIDAYKQAKEAAPVEGAPPETTINLNQIKGADDFKQHIESFASLVAKKPERMNMKALAEEMRNDGYSDSFVNKIIDTSKAIKAKPEEVFKMRYAHLDSSARTFEEANTLIKAIESGTATPEMYAKVRQAGNMEGLIVNGMTGKRSDVSRALRAFGEALEAQAEKGPILDNLINSSGGMDDIEHFARAYVSANKTTRAKMAQRSLGSKVKDIWMTTWINGLLSSPVTHVKNMTANAGYVGLNIAEKQVASLIGKTRNIIFNSEDYIRQQEILVDMYSLKRGVQEGMALGAEAWKRNSAVTGRSKVEVRTSADPFGVDLPDDATPFQKMMGKAWGIYGQYVTLPGRALLSADEFFKGVNYRRSLDSAGFREYIKVRDEAVQAGVDVSEAKMQGQKAMLRILDDPDDAVHNEAVSLAEEMTFTGKLEGGLGYMEKLVQNPVAKMFVPFIRTPTNIAIELNKRLPTPGLFVSKKTRDDWAAGGIRRDMVMARVGLGSMTMWGVSNLALEGRITGAGPFTPERRNGLKAINWQPYSFVFDSNEVSKEQIAEFKKYTTVKSGNGKVFVSYAGLEPIGALLGIGATMGEYSIFEPDAGAMEQLFLGGSLGVADYITELPMISGVSEMMQIFTGGGSTASEKALSVIKRATEQASDFALGGFPFAAQSSLIAYSERVLNPERRQPKAEIQNIGEMNEVLAAPFKGFMDSLANYKSRNPYFSKDAPPVLDPITGEQLEHPSSKAWMRAFPFRLSEQKYSPAYDVLNTLGIGQPPVKRKIDGIELTPSQRNRWIELATKEVVIERKTLEIAVIDSVNDDKFIKLLNEDPEKAKSFVRGIVSDYYSEAKKRLMEEELPLKDSVDYKKVKKGEEILTRIETML